MLLTDLLVSAGSCFIFHLEKYKKFVKPNTFGLFYVVYISPNSSSRMCGCITYFNVTKKEKTIQNSKLTILVKNE